MGQYLRVVTLYISAVYEVWSLHTETRDSLDFIVHDCLLAPLRLWRPSKQRLGTLIIRKLSLCHYHQLHLPPLVSHRIVTTAGSGHWNTSQRKWLKLSLTRFPYTIGRDHFYCFQVWCIACKSRICGEGSEILSSQGEACWALHLPGYSWDGQW